jgi:tryptophan synthase beta subunit
VRRSLSAWPGDIVVLLNLSGRGDKDVETVRALMAKEEPSLEMAP